MFTPEKQQSENSQSEALYAELTDQQKELLKKYENPFFIPEQSPGEALGLLVRLENGEIITPYDEAKKLLDDVPATSKSKLISATELLNSKITEMPSLWGQFIPKGELCALMGGSDTGKSTFLRQLAFSVALKQKEFIGFPLNAEHGKVIYVSTEDGRNAITVSLKKQLGESFDANTVNGLGFLIDTPKPLNALKAELELTKIDLIILDCFGDIFHGSINDSVSVRQFLAPYKLLCAEYGCTIIVLHHANKSKDAGNGANKNNVLGSVAFEGANRVVMELRKESESNVRKLWFTKGNYMSEASKKAPLVLNFGNDLMFSLAEKQETTGGIKGKIKIYPDDIKAAIIVAALKCRKDGLSIDDTIDALKEMKFEKVPSKGTLHAWLANESENDSQSADSLV